MPLIYGNDLFWPLFKISLIKNNLGLMDNRSAKVLLGNESLGRLPYPLPLLEGKKLKKKCCKKFKKGKRCKNCPGRAKSGKE